MLNLLFSGGDCTDDFGVTLGDEYLSCAFSVLGLCDSVFGVPLVEWCCSCFFPWFGTGFGSGKAFLNWLTSNGSVSILYGGVVSRRWIIFKPSDELNLSTTSRYIPGGSRISSSCLKYECDRISFPLVVSIENIVRGPEAPAYCGDSNTLIAKVQELTPHQANFFPFW